MSTFALCDYKKHYEWKATNKKTSKSRKVGKYKTDIKLLNEKGHKKGKGNKSDRKSVNF